MFFSHISVAFIFVISLFVIILVTILVYGRLGSHSKNISIYYTLTREGYSFDKAFEHYITKIDGTTFWDQIFTGVRNYFTISKGDLSITIEALTESKGENSESIYKVSFFMPKHIRETADLEIKKRNFLDKVFGFNKGDYPNLSADFSLKCSNVLLVNYLISIRENRQIIKEIMSRTKVLNFRHQNVLKMGQKTSNLFRTIRDIEDLVSVTEKILKEVNNDRRYSIEEINLFSLMTENIFSCVICRQEIINSDLRILNCCGSSAHRTHIESWLEKDPRCPYCKKTNVKLLIPRIQKPNSQFISNK